MESIWLRETAKTESGGHQGNAVCTRQQSPVSECQHSLLPNCIPETRGPFVMDVMDTCPTLATATNQKLNNVQTSLLTPITKRLKQIM